MSKPDLILKEYWSSNEQFADLFNSALFGKEVLRPEKVTEMDTNMSSILPLVESTKDKTTDILESIEVSRDVMKIVKISERRCLVLLGIENQMDIHYAMVLRTMVYDALTYWKQYIRIKKKHREQKDLKTGAEFLSGMQKTDRIIPVITLVMYYGDEPWDAAKTMHEMMDPDEDIRPYVSDYKMNLFQARDNHVDFENKNNRDFFRMLQISFDDGLSKREKEQAILQYVEDREKEIDNKVIQAVATTSGVVLPITEEGGTAMCCKFFAELRDEGRVEGKAEGKLEQIIDIGLEENWSDQKIVNWIQRKIGYTEEEARAYLETHHVAMV